MMGSKRMRPSVASIDTMKVWVWAVSAMAALAMAALSGCQANDTLTPQGEGKPSGTASSNSGQTNPDAPDGGTTPHKPDPAKIQKGIDQSRTPSPDVLVSENPPSWENAKEAPPEVEKTLGSKIDEALSHLPPALVAVTIEVSDKGSLLRSAPVIKIQDKTRFDIQYALPETQADVNRLTGDGTKRVKLEGGKVQELPPLSAGKPTAKMSRKQIEEFAKRMPGDGFGFYADGGHPWSAFVEGLNDPKNGFKVTTEVQNAKPVGDERPFYRMYAESTTGDKLKIEFVVDTKRNVPVLFRSNFVYPDGTTRDMVWRGNWSFGGTHDKKDFVLPKSPQK